MVIFVLQDEITYFNIKLRLNDTSFVRSGFCNDYNFAVIKSKTTTDMKKNFFIALFALMCTKTFAQTGNGQTWSQLSMQLVEDKNITVATGAHRAPARIEFPLVYINNDETQIYIGKSDMYNGATYRIKDEYSNLLISGTITFGENDFYMMCLATLSPGCYILEIETQNYIFGTQFIY